MSLRNHGAMVIAVDMWIVTPYQRELLNGVMAFFSNQSGVKLFLPKSPIVHQETAAVVDGVVSLTPKRLDESIVKAMRPSTPVVSISQDEPDGNTVCVQVDQDSVCRMAFDHFRECNLRTFAFLHPVGHATARFRESAFAEVCRAAGYPLNPLRFHRESQDYESIRQTLTDLPKPVGVLLASDQYAGSFIESCQRWGLTVPGDVQVIGTSFDMETGLACRPQLTSIVLNVKTIGFEAARKLWRMMEGRPVDTVTKVEPYQVIQRESTALDMKLNPQVKYAVDFMFENMTEEITMADVLANQSLSRRSIELLFRKDLGQTPMQYLCNMRLERMCQLLTTTDLSVKDIGRQCGFHNTDYIYRVFRKHKGCTPKQYRKRSRDDLLK